MKIEPSDFSARDSLMGYLYQCRYALYECLRRGREEEEFKASIETLEDIVFLKGDAIELLQSKHSIKNHGNITDASTDLWKTIRIWCEIISGDLDSTPSFFFITTQKVSDGSAAYYIKKREISKAIDRLNATALTSTTPKNQKAYKVFKDLSLDEKKNLFNNVSIVDSVPTISNIHLEIRKQVRWTTKTKFLDSFLQRLEGWWFQRVIDHIQNKNDVIHSMEIDSQIDMIREQFNEENLPIDKDILNFTIKKSVYSDRTFVKQLKIIKESNDNIFLAIKNFYRAFEHRTRWTLEELLIPDELEQYEDILIDEWKICHNRMKENLGDSVASEVKEKSARTLYWWLGTHNHFIRPGVTHPSICRGSYHMLAEDERIGWHPDFEKELKKLLV